MLLTVRPFAELSDVVSGMSRAFPSASPVDQVRYLASYLGHAQPETAKTIVCEHPYVDRHWLEECVGYYASALHPPPSHATRLHFFSGTFDRASFIDVLGAAANSEEARSSLGNYLGFVVVRPLPSAPIGRSVLKPYGSDSTRNYSASRRKTVVHLAGLKFPLEGLPFQQQDRCVGACATAALWSALSKVSHSDGRRAPTPLEITRAATASSLVSRAFPAMAGLTLEQMCGAVEHFGYSPHVLRPSGETDIILMWLKTYLRSGIPIVARTAPSGRGEGHAITLVGFREADDDDNHLQVPSNGSTNNALRMRRITRFYAHDDSLGPYARLDLEIVKPTEGTENELRLKLNPTEGGFEKFAEPTSFWQAIVPLYKKIRLTAEDLIEHATSLVPAVKALTGKGSADIFCDLKIVLSGEYTEEVLTRSSIDRARRVDFVSNAFFSRYVGVVSFRSREGWLADFIYDGTEVQRDERTHAPILAVLLAEASARTKLESGYIREALRLTERVLIP